MSWQPTALPELPEATARAARAAYRRHPNLYLTIGDQLGDVFADVDFSPLYAADGKPALSPHLLILVSIFQRMENLADREAAEAVRSRLDWKYALHLALEDPGFDASALSEFRERLAAQALGPALFETVLKRLQALDLLHKGGQQRTDATATLGANRQLNRVQLVAETLRLALAALADAQPDWLPQIALPHWYARYGLVLTGFRLPRAKAQLEALALEIAGDGFHLLAALAAPGAPAPAAHLGAVQTLAQVWQQQFEWAAAGPRWRPPAAKPPMAQTIVTPHDPALRFTRHHRREWEGYQTHWTETCDPDQPHLITHVAVVPAPTVDVALLPQIHADLARLGLLPAEHLVDTGYTSARNFLASWRRYGVRLIGPVHPGGNWQSGVPGGITQDQFALDFQRQTARCPQGATASVWREHVESDGTRWTEVAFPKEVCAACAVRTRCTQATHRGRALRLAEHYPFMRDARTYQPSAEFRQEYARRAGMEGTVSEAVRRHGARRSRYFGQPKTELQALLTAIAINLKRTARWLLGERPATTRPPGLACLAPA